MLVGFGSFSFPYKYLQLDMPAKKNEREIERIVSKKKCAKNSLISL